MAGQNKTPDERSEVLKKAHKKAKKSYKSNLTKRTSVTPEELVVIKDQLAVLKLVGYTNTQCAAIVGLSKGQTREIVSNRNFQSRLAKLQKSLPAAAISLGQAYLIEGVQAVVHVMRTETDNALVLKAAAELFDRFGVAKLTRSEIKNELPPPADTQIPSTVMDKLRSASPEVQESIASLHESFLEGVERILGDNGGTDKT